MTFTSLRRIVKKRMLDDMIAKVEGDWKVLVVDPESMPVLASACRNRDVMDRHVTIVENLSMKRQPLPNYPAIYLLSPSQQSVDLFIEDFREVAQYQSAHIFFTNHAKDSIIECLAKSHARPYIKTLTEINVDFQTSESMVFNLGMPYDVAALFNGHPEVKVFERIADQLVSLCCTLNENPDIRHQGSVVSTGLAKVVHTRLQEYMRTNRNFNPPTENKGTLLILDRSIDMCAPLLHELTYEAMLQDMLTPPDLEGHKFRHTVETGSGSTKKEVLLDELDQMWLDFRHKHIADVINDVVAAMKSFQAKHKDKDKQGLKEMDLKKMGDLMRSMPQYQEQLSKISLHSDISSRLMAQYNAELVEVIAGVEQDLATGERRDQSSVGEKDAEKLITELIRNPKISEEKKMRALLLYICSQGGVKDATYGNLIRQAGFTSRYLPDGPSPEELIKLLTYFGIALGSRSNKTFSLFSKSKKKRSASRAREDSYDLSRYVPGIKGVVESHLAGKLNVADFPYVSEPEASGVATSSGAGGKSLRTAPKAKWLPGRKGKGDLGQLEGETGDLEMERLGITEGPRTIVFVAGGLMHSETRSIYEVIRETKREVIVGGTRVLSAREFMDSLCAAARTK